MPLDFRPRTLALLALVLATAPLPALAWWNTDYSQRTKVMLNTSSAGIATVASISGAAVPVRLHSGNFDFLAAKSDGSDLRVVAGDDKTPLPFMVERFDGASELAVLWVKLPTVAPGTDQNLLYVYAGNPTAAAEPAQPVAENDALLTLRFDDSGGAVRDVSGTPAALSPGVADPSGLIGFAASFDGTRVTELPATDRVRAATGAPYSISLWARPAVIGGTLLAQGPLSLGLDNGKVVARLGTVQVAGGTLPPSSWVHIGLTQGEGKLTLYVDGTQAAQADLPANVPAIAGPLRIGENYRGLLDQLQIAGRTRSAEWMTFTRAAQGADARLVAAQLERSGEAAQVEGGHGGYIGVLVKNLTVDAWVVIGILGVMFVVSLWVMVSKALTVTRTDRGNQRFLLSFREASDVTTAPGAALHANASLARLYDAGMVQLNKRNVGQPDAQALSGASIDAVKAAIDADLVRENHRLNGLMVLLTIAISGGPFLGLLGTVVGVMITFAAIAAAGDVNVNAIAPGIAAALLATVAGLAVAIPALFGYNWLSSKIRNISADMQIFVDEFVTRVAERYGQR